MHGIDITTLEFDPELTPGARNAVRTCLALQPTERVALIVSRSSREIAAALAAEIREIGSEVEIVVLEECAERPLHYLPDPAREALSRAQVSIFTADAQPGELAMRRAMTGIVNERRMRHAHMVGVCPRIMREGMRADFEVVDSLTRWVIERARRTKVITCTTPAGTDLKAELDPNVDWFNTSGLIRPEKWGNLPGGETFTSPGRVDGVFVVDGVLGDWLAPKHGDMRENPLTIEIEDSRIVRTECADEAALDDFLEYTSTDENSNRVGEFACGTNIAVKDLIGNMLQDEKIPGIHIAFGHPYSEHTGVPWRSSTHIDVVGRNFSIWFDGKAIMKDGRYLTDEAL